MRLAQQIVGDDRDPRDEQGDPHPFENAEIRAVSVHRSVGKDRVHHAVEVAALGVIPAAHDVGDLASMTPAHPGIAHPQRGNQRIGDGGQEFFQHGRLILSDLVGAEVCR